MRQYLAYLCFGFFFFILLPDGHATHNRAGEITVRILGDCQESLTIEATIVTYTKTSSFDADRDSLEICWDDGTCEFIYRTNGNVVGGFPQGEPLENDIKKNIYIGIHTYSARGTYRISTNDPNRIFDIENIPNSLSTKFHIQTVYTFGSPQFQTCNNTPILTVPPVDFACIDQVWQHNPGAVDFDNDSLAYRLTTPLFDIDRPIQGYVLPDEVGPDPGNSITIDERTGDIVWDSPKLPGEYNIAIFIISYRNGIPIDTVMRDMQILVRECDNIPPVIETEVEEICVVAGEVLQFGVTATAPIFESNQKVRLTAAGGPFEQPISPAEFLPDNEFFQDDPLQKTFRWQTECEHISDQFYQVVFRAVDNFFGDSSGLATLKTIRIKVVGPPPQDVQAQSASDVITVSWEMPYSCEVTENNYFQGFSVWRREMSNPFVPDECENGLEGRGYIKLNTQLIQDFDAGRYFYIDDDVQRGRTYCYRILAVFAQQSESGNYIFNLVESLPSEEACEQLERNLPLINKVDVLSTDVNSGSIEVCWFKPDPDALDTLNTNPGPYQYELQRAPGLNPSEAEYQSIWTSPSYNSFAAANDTCFTDTGLNTTDLGYSYRVVFYVVGNVELGSSEEASSVYLTASPTDNANDLTWEYNVPWSNFDFVVFRQAPNGDFIILDTVSTPSYRDENLPNGVEQCYKVLSLGTYSLEGLNDTLLNNSQEACSSPFDNVDPCPPSITVSNLCEEATGCISLADLENELNWILSDSLCSETDDVLGFKIYYAPFDGGEFSEVGSLDEPFEFNYFHMPPTDRGLAGCYAVTSIDSVGNESVFSNIVCADNCPVYDLPNTFTPNGDGFNDMFRPFPFCFIERVDFKVFNRWGQVVFEAEDPDLNWDGKNFQGTDLAEGVYYYSCRVYEQRVDNNPISNSFQLSGYIELLR
ncbi:MAG: gliding motility-associated C-terminal domain-containing protein [Saprospiraceae bacterium]|nr:gliding motility-associated C-terminal domain-containing protein [Saprospiraceae bacterium]